MFQKGSVAQDQAFNGFDKQFESGKLEADQYYADLQKNIASKEERLVQRQALAGLVWTKQFYNIDIQQWLDGDPSQPTPPEERKSGRNREWGTSITPM